MNTLWVGLGGALGSIARYQLGLFTASRASGFPWGTLAVNLLGSLLISILTQLFLRGRIDEATRVALGVGLLGGFTTYSSFNVETLALAQAGMWGRAALYLLVTVVGCLALGVVGWFAGRAL